MSRARNREGFDERVRITLLEGDMDDTEAEITEMRREFRRLTATIVGAAITLAITAILLGVTLSV